MTQQGTVSTEPRHIRVSEIVERHGEPPWSEWLFTDGRNSVNLICDAPGLENDAHLHPDFNEWWIVLQGEFIWEIGDYPPLRARVGDIAFVPEGMRHRISTVGDETSLRLTVTNTEGGHIYTDDDEAAPPSIE